MDENLDNLEPGQISENPESANNNKQNPEEPVAAPEPEPTPEQDYATLSGINVLKAVLIKMQGGRHPSAQIDALLQRRMNFARDSFQGPYLTRLASTLMMIFVAATLIWAVLWILAGGFGLNYFLRLLSTGLATLVAALFGIAVFHPSAGPDEALLKEAIAEKMNELRALIPESETIADEEDNSTLVDANIEEQNRVKSAPASTLNSDALSQMPSGLENMKPELQLADDGLDLNGKSISPGIPGATENDENAN